jgi:hypothetical protein
MTLGSFRFGLRFTTFPQNTLHYYSDWQYVQALAQVITGAIVIARKVSWSPKMLDGEDAFLGHDIPIDCRGRSESTADLPLKVDLEGVVFSGKLGC